MTSDEFIEPSTVFPINMSMDHATSTLRVSDEKVFRIPARDSNTGPFGLQTNAQPTVFFSSFFHGRAVVDG